MTSSLKRCERVAGNILLAIVKTASDREAALEMHGVRNSENRMPPVVEVRRGAFIFARLSDTSGRKNAVRTAFSDPPMSPLPK